MTDTSPWYAAGLHFECTECGDCCSGPGDGVIWVTKPEIQMIADFLKVSVDQLRRRYLRRIGLRTTIIEEPNNKDCIFLYKQDNTKRCRIYPVRPNQCRTWPFWASNLTSTRTWNEAARKCPGINRGRLYSCEEIERLKKQRKWWTDA